MLPKRRAAKARSIIKPTTALLKQRKLAKSALQKFDLLQARGGSAEALIRDFGAMFYRFKQHAKEQPRYAERDFMDAMNRLVSVNSVLSAFGMQKVSEKELRALFFL